MTPITLPPLLSRSLAVALLVALVFAVWAVVVQPVVAELRDTGLRIAETREFLDRYRRINAGRDGIEAELARWRDEVLPDSGLLAGADPTVAAAELQSRVSEIIKRGQGDLLSIQILGTAEEAGLQRVPVRVQFTADTEAVTRIFYDLESAKPYLFIDNLQIRAGRTARRARIARLRRGAEQAEAAPAETLFVTADVYGFMRDDTS